MTQFPFQKIADFLVWDSGVQVFSYSAIVGFELNFL
jgi:hypothetical protein